MSLISKINVNNSTYEISSDKDVSVVDSTSSSDFQIADENMNIIMEFKDGHIKTKEFDSRNINGAKVVKDSNGKNILYL